MTIFIAILAVLAFLLGIALCVAAFKIAVSALSVLFIILTAISLIAVFLNVLFWIWKKVFKLKLFIGTSIFSIICIMITLALIF